MNTDIIKGNWNEVKGKLQKKWGKLTDDELKTMNGERTELIGHLQKKYGYSKDEASKQVDKFVKDNHLN